MHRCPVEECAGHDDLGEVIVHAFHMISVGQSAIFRELRHLRGVVPPHVQAGMNALDEQIRVADQALSHQSARAHHNQGRNQ